MSKWRSTVESRVSIQVTVLADEMESAHVNCKARQASTYQSRMTWNFKCSWWLQRQLDLKRNSEGSQQQQQRRQWTWDHLRRWRPCWRSRTILWFRQLTFPLTYRLMFSSTYTWLLQQKCALYREPVPIHGLTVMRIDIACATPIVIDPPISHMVTSSIVKSRDLHVQHERLPRTLQ